MAQVLFFFFLFSRMAQGICCHERSNHIWNICANWQHNRWIIEGMPSSPSLYMSIQNISLMIFNGTDGVILTSSLAGAMGTALAEGVINMLHTCDTSLVSSPGRVACATQLALNPNYWMDGWMVQIRLWCRGVERVVGRQRGEVYG